MHSLNRGFLWFETSKSFQKPKINMTLLATLSLCFSLSILADLLSIILDYLLTSFWDKVFKILACLLQKQLFEPSYVHFIWILHTGMLPLFLPHNLFRFSFFDKLQRHLYRYCGTEPTNRIMKQFISAKSVLLTGKFNFILSRGFRAIYSPFLQKCLVNTNTVSIKRLALEIKSNFIAISKQWLI